MKSFRKLLCVLLSVLMAVSSCVVFASAEGEDSDFDYDEKQLIDFSTILDGFTLETYDIPDLYGYDIDALIASGVLSNVNVGGMSLDDIYNSTDPINWYDMTIDGSTLYLAMGNINLYFKNFFKKYYTPKTLYTSENATWLANQICAVVFGPNHDEVVVKLDNTQVGDKLAFVKAVAYSCRSGITSLIDLVQTNWIDSDMNYLPIVYALGVDLYDIYNKEKASEVVQEIILAMIDNFLEDPLYSILDVIWAVCRRYDAYMTVPMKALLSYRISSGAITEEEFSQPHNLLNLIFNNNNSADTEHLQFFTAPYQRFAIAQDREEVFYYLLVYMMLIGNYGSNKNVIAGYKADIQAMEKFEQKDRDYICDLLDGCTSGDLNKVLNFINGVLVSNVTDTVNNWFLKILNRIKEIFVEFVERLDAIFGFPSRWR